MATKKRKEQKKTVTGSDPRNLTAKHAALARRPTAARRKPSSQK